MCISSEVSYFLYVKIISKLFNGHTLGFIINLITDFVSWFLYSQENLRARVSIYLFIHRACS